MTEPFKVTDRRSSTRRLVLGESVAQARTATGATLPGGRMPANGIPVPGASEPPRPGVLGDSTQNATARRMSRRIAARQATGAAGAAPGGGGGASINFATGRPRDPMFYWRQNNIPYDFTKDEQLRKVREFSRLLYLTHPIVASCVDIYSKFPLQGMHFRCKDQQLEDFHESLFMEDLQYREFLTDVGKEYWTAGEAWPLGSFNEVLGVWDDDELMHPNDVEVERNRFIKEPRFQIRLPQSLRDVLVNKSPRWEYEKLINDYPELQSYAAEDALMPVSNILLQQLKFSADTFNKRGIPILMRGFRSVMQEEMLMAAMDAIADRLYTPLLLAKLGASARDLGTDTPWIPNDDDLAAFEESFDAALAGDFRLLIHNFGVDLQSVFGRENMPDMTNDFNRIEDRLMMVFGLSRTMLQGAGEGETYAADALNKDVVSQLLTDYQRSVKRLYRQRALIVAEAQEHYDYDISRGRRYVKMEEVLEYDEDGEPHLIEQPKLLVPELEFDAMSLTDESVERNFLEQLNESGVPVPIRRRIMGTGMKFDDMLDEREREQVDLAVRNQQVRRATYTALARQGLPIPQDLIEDFRPKATQAQQPIAGNSSENGPMPTLGVSPPANPAIAPTLQDLTDGSQQDAVAATADGATDPLMQAPEVGGQRPPESDEMRGFMPQAPQARTGLRRYAHLHDDAEPYQLRSSIRSVTAAHYEPPVDWPEDAPHQRQPSGQFGTPRHVGMRRHVRIPESEKVASAPEPRAEDESPDEDDPARESESET